MTESHRLAEGAVAPFLEDGQLLDGQTLRRQEEQMMDVLDRIMDAAEGMGATIRAIGSIAFRKKCPDFKYMEYENGRYLTDIDFVTYSRDIALVQDMFTELGWEENMNVLRLFGDKRRIFYHPRLPIHSDVFLDKLRFCHQIDFRGRLELDYPTITIVDLLLEKLQIVEINRKDLVDTMMLLRQHSMCDDPQAVECIDCSRIADLCRRDWGWWRTATMNLGKLEEYSREYLSAEDSELVISRIHEIESTISDSPKTLSWKLRSLVGDRVRWYREVEEVERD